MSTTILITVLASAIGGVCLAFLVFRLGILCWLYDARIDEDGITFLILTIPIWRLTYKKISRVREVKRSKLSDINAVSFRNRSFSGGFVLEKNDGWYTRKIIITPADPDFFKKTLASKNIEFVG